MVIVPFCQSPPNFLHAASLAKHVKPVVVIPDEYGPEQQEDDDDDPEPLIEVSDVSTPSLQAAPQVWYRSLMPPESLHCHPSIYFKLIFFFLSNSTYSIRRLDLRMEASMIGEPGCF